MAFRDLSLRVKLPLLVMVTTGVALLLASSTYLVVTHVSKRREMENQVRVLAVTLAEQSSPAMAFDQPDFAQTILGALREVKHIAGAAIHRSDGRELARYTRENTPTVPMPPSLEPGSLEMDGYFMHTASVLQGGRAIGTLTLQSDMSPVMRSLELNLLVTLIALLLAMVTAVTFALMMGRVITRPVLMLAGTMQDVIERGDYSQQAPAHGGDEVGRLIQGFNNMILRIRERDEALQKTHGELQERQAELSTYHDLVTHDLTNFAGTLQVIVQHLLSRGEGNLSENQEQLLKRANRQIFQLNRLADNAKTLVRLREEGLPVSREPVGLRPLIDRAVESVRSVHFDRQSAFDVDVEDGLTVTGVPFLENILLNILDNAVRHSAPGQPAAVSVRAARKEGRVHLAVQGGEAVPQEFLDKIFRRYARGERSTGSGLGLSVVREILERFGGEVAVRNVDQGGKGMFEITLMLKAG